MKKKILLITLALLLAIGLVATSCAAPAPETTTLNILTAKEGTASHIFGFEFSRLLEKNHPWLRVLNRESPGSKFNTEAMALEPERWPNTIVTSGLYITGILLDEDPVKYKALEDMREITSYNISGPIFFQTFDEKIRTPQDLVGKRIGLGTKAQTFWGIMASAQLRAWGVIDKVDIEWLGTADSSRALVDGAVDVSATSLYIGAGDKPGVQLGLPLADAIATGRDVYYIVPTEEEAIAAQERGAAWPVAWVPAGSIPNQEQDIYGLALTNGYAAHKSLSEEAVYELVNFLFDYYEEWYPAHALFKLLTPTVQGFGSGLPYHPGALRAYNEYAEANPNSEAVRYWKKWGTIQ